MNAQPHLTLKAIKCLLIALLTSLSIQAHAVIAVDWALQNPTLSNESFNGIARNGNGTTISTTLVVVGSHGVILSSTTGAGGSWTVQSSGTTQNLNSVAWLDTPTNPRFVAVGDKGVMLTSFDGATWTKRDLVSGTPAVVASEDFVNVAWSSSSSQLYIAANGAATGVVYASDNSSFSSGSGPSTWKRFPSVAAKLRSAASSSGVLVGVSSTGFVTGNAHNNSAAWAASPFPNPSNTPTAIVAETSIKSVVFTGSTFVISGASGYTGSPGGWTRQSGLTNAQLSLTWNPAPSGGNEIVGVGADGVVAHSSNGGVDWTFLPPVEVGLQLNCGVKFGTDFVVVGDSGRIWKYSGSAWTSVYGAGFIDNLEAVAYNGTSTFVALGKNAALTSTNATSWTRTAATIDPLSVAWLGTQFVATGNNGIWTSTNGTGWTQTVLSPALQGRLNRVRALAGGKAIAVGADTSTTLPASLIYQFDGVNWVKNTVTGGTKELRGTAASATVNVVVGDAGLVLTSPITVPATANPKWTAKTVVLKTGEGFTDVIFSDGQFMASTNLGGAWTSADGLIWTKRLANATASINRLVNATAQYVGIGSVGTVIRSFGGGFWYESNADTSQLFKDAVWTGSSLVAVGSHGTIKTSTGPQPDRPTLNFAFASSSANEADGTVALHVLLSPASPLPVTVNVSGSSFSATIGTTATSDYSLGSSTLTFAPNDTDKTVSVSIKQDNVDENDETATITLSSPTGDATLGTIVQHVLTIVDDDERPGLNSYADQPQHQLVNVGDAVSLSANPTGNPLPTAQWKKNNASIAGAAALLNPYVIPSATTTLAGAYSVLFTNHAGTLLSGTAQLGVVDNTPKSVVVAENGNVTLTVTAAGNGLSYQWMKGSGGTPVWLADTVDHITGATKASVTIKKVLLSEEDTYFCQVTQTTPEGTLAVTGGTTTVYVVNAKPIVGELVGLQQAVVFPKPNKVVGEAFDFTPTATNHPFKWALTNQTSVQTKLPAGLLFDTATGRIHGTPTQSGTFTLSFVATNVIGASVTVLGSLTIDPLPDGVVGTFMGIIFRDTLNGGPGNNGYVAEDVDGKIVPGYHSLGGRLDVTTTATGAFTGKFTVGTTPTAFSGTLTYAPAPAAPDPLPPGFVAASPSITATVVAAPVGLLPVTITLAITPSSFNPVTPLRMTVYDGAEFGGFTPRASTAFGAWRNSWLGRSPALIAHITDGSTRYNFALSTRAKDPPATDDPNGIFKIDIPQGVSFGSLTISNSPLDGVGGKFTIAGQMADGVAFTTAGFLDGYATRFPGSTTFFLPLYAGMYNNTGSVIGMLGIYEVAGSGTSAGFKNNGIYNPLNISWFKATQPAGSTLSYINGFERDGNNDFYPLQLSTMNGCGRYTPPPSTDIVMGLAAGTDNTYLKFYEGGVNRLVDNTTIPPTYDLLVATNPDVSAFTVQAPALVSMWPVGVNNPAGATVTYDPITGTFKGTFTLVGDEDPTSTSDPKAKISRTGSYNGIMIGFPRPGPLPNGGGNGSNIQNGVGTFSLHALPSDIDRTTLATSPIYNGAVKTGRTK